ncbi:hypothetical protein L218DRAFT_1008484 [Marasmius fiardii PR-910]|nr:hypothetical protein L218DRAFT_1008484 [Marasmius fiardii PR-910]
MERTLRFYFTPRDLKKDVDIVLTFQAPTKEVLSHKQNMAAWKVAKLEKGGTTTGSFEAYYSARLGFCVAEIEEGNIISPRLPIEMKTGELTTLTDKPTRGWSFPPTKIQGNLMKAVNKTDMYQNISVGTVVDADEHGHIDLKPTFNFNVGAGNTVEADFHPKLMMYANLGYQDNQLMSVDETTPIIWEAKLDELPKISKWNIVEKSQGGYEVTPD